MCDIFGWMYLKWYSTDLVCPLIKEGRSVISRSTKAIRILHQSTLWLRGRGQTPPPLRLREDSLWWTQYPVDSLSLSLFLIPFQVSKCPISCGGMQCILVHLVPATHARLLISQLLVSWHELRSGRFRMLNVNSICACVLADTLNTGSVNAGCFS